MKSTESMQLSLNKNSECSTGTEIYYYIWGQKLRSLFTILFSLFKTWCFQLQMENSIQAYWYIIIFGCEMEGY